MSKPIHAPFLLLTATFAMFAVGCSSAPAVAGGTTGRMVAASESFAMQRGETVVLADRTTLRYVSIKSDSRCPPGVQCIQAGNALVGFESRPAGGSIETFELNSSDQPQSRDLGSVRVTLQSLAFGDAPQAQLKVERDN
ncbi:MAG: hypothetical protein LH470_08865 [Lysobacter sp.]|nr:hypothetical protein [Lysobacter sp.]